MSTLLKKLLVLTALVVAVPAVSFAITIDLNPASQFPTTFQGQQVIAVGKDGLYLDSRTTAPATWQGTPNAQVAFATWSNPANNFTWLDVTMEIDDVTGNATINGTMRNNANASDLYSLTMNLTGMCVRNGANCTARSAVPNIDLRAFLENPANARNSTLGEGLNTGFEWSTLSLSIANLPGGPNPVYNGVTEYVGWTMAPHVNPIELLIWSNSPGPGSLYLAAWYQAFNAHGQRTALGDTKSFGSLLPRIPDPDPIPEPSTMLLLGTAGLGLLRRKHKRS